MIAGAYYWLVRDGLITRGLVTRGVRGICKYVFYKTGACLILSWCQANKTSVTLIGQNTCTSEVKPCKSWYSSTQMSRMSKVPCSRIQHSGQAGGDLVVASQTR